MMRPPRLTNKEDKIYMIEIHWGHQMTLITPHDGAVIRISTIEKARYWLKSKWPAADAASVLALAKIEAAMDCLIPVEDARRAFLTAATTAGFHSTKAA